MRTVAALAVVASVVAGVAATTAQVAGAQDGPVKIEDVYVTMDDGVRLATDIYLPPGTPSDGSVQVPCLVELTPYRKEVRAAQAISFLPQAGFGVIQVDARGTGGSEGQYDIVFSLREQWDTAEIIDWAATDSGFCTDRVGMFGGSYSGIIQYLVASLPPDRAPQHLTAIAPQRAYGDLYRDIVYHGGQMIASFGILWSSGTSVYYYQPPTNIDTPQGLAAWTDHLSNDPMIVPYLLNPYVDAIHDAGLPTEQALYLDSSVLERMEHLSVPTFHLAGWFDSFTRGQLLTFQQGLAVEQAGHGGPHYLAIGPWNHSGTHFAYYDDLRERLVEWYRYWLADGPQPVWFGDDRLRYYTMHAGGLDDATGSWDEVAAWPPPGVRYDRLYLTPDGGLAPDVPAEAEVRWLYDPTVGVTAWPSRWDNAAGVPQSTTDQRLDGDRSGATFLTPVLDQDLTVAGPLSLRLQAATVGLPGLDAPIDGLPPLVDALVPPYHDTDFVVKVSDVQPDGTAELITEGFLRASHRALDPERSQVVDGEVVVPFHLHTRDAVAPPPVGEVVEYWIEVWPTAKTFPAGHRLRVDIHSADTPNHVNLVRPSLNTVVTGAETYLVLPVLGEDAEVGTEGDLHVAVVALVVLARLQPVRSLLASPAHVRKVVCVGVVELTEPLLQQLSFQAATDRLNRTIPDLHRYAFAHVLLEDEHHVPLVEHEDALSRILDRGAVHHPGWPDVPPSGNVRDAVDPEGITTLLGQRQVRTGLGGDPHLLGVLHELLAGRHAVT
jgi:uncharacterized protein